MGVEVGQVCQALGTPVLAADALHGCPDQRRPDRNSASLASRGGGDRREPPGQGGDLQDRGMFGEVGGELLVFAA